MKYVTGVVLCWGLLYLATAFIQYDWFWFTQVGAWSHSERGQYCFAFVLASVFGLWLTFMLTALGETS